MHRMQATLQLSVLRCNRGIQPVPSSAWGEPQARMKKRKLLIGLTTAGLFLAGFGAAVLPASAEQRTLAVTLATGQTVTVTVDVPPGTPLSQIHIPGITGTIVAVTEIGGPPP